MTRVNVKPRFQYDQDNAPQPLPGIYGIYNPIENRWYIGMSKNIQQRAIEHASYKTHQEGEKLANAFERYGVHTFVFIPLFYTFTTDRVVLSEVEAEFISSFKACSSGYNTYPCGPFTDCNMALLGASIKRVLNSPEVRQRHLATLKRAQEVHGEYIVSQLHLGRTLRWADVKNRAVHSAYMASLRWITNGVQNRRIPGKDLPEGWRFGKTDRNRTVSQRDVLHRPGAQEAARRKTLEVYARKHNA